MHPARPESMRELIELIRSDSVLTELHAVARRAGAGDPAHDVAHAERVALWTVRLAPRSPPRTALSKNSCNRASFVQTCTTA